jgi:hypothetical protein
MTTRCSAPRCHYRFFLFLCRTQESLPTIRIERVVASDSWVSATEDNAVGRWQCCRKIRPTVLLQTHLLCALREVQQVPVPVDIPSRSVYRYRHLFQFASICHTSVRTCTSRLRYRYVAGWSVNDAHVGIRVGFLLLLVGGWAVSSTYCSTLRSTDCT